MSENLIKEIRQVEKSDKVKNGDKAKSSWYYSGQIAGVRKMTEILLK